MRKYVATGGWRIYVWHGEEIWLPAKGGSKTGILFPGIPGKPRDIMDIESNMEGYSLPNSCKFWFFKNLK